MSWSLNSGQTAQHTARSDSQQKTNTISKEFKYFLKSIEPYLTSPPHIVDQIKSFLYDLSLGGLPHQFPMYIVQGTYGSCISFYSARLEITLPSFRNEI